MIKNIWFTFALFSIAAFTQQKDTTYQTLISQAKERAQLKDYQRAISLYLKSLSLPESEPWQSSIHYNIGCYYALLNEPEKAFEHIEQAIQFGLTDYNMLRNDPDFSSLSLRFPERVATVVAKVEKAFYKARIEQSPIAITSFDNYIGPAKISNYVWDDFYHPKMDSLRKKYQLLKIVELGKTEFEKMKLMLDWASQRFQHHSSNLCKGGDALAILSEAEKGAQFSCTDYARLLANCLIALGYPARTVGLTWLGSAFGNPDAHVCAEVWSNQYQKWILFDGQNNAWWETRGMPLNAQECRHLFITGCDSEMVFVGQIKGANYSQMKSYWASHFYHLSYGNYYAFFDPTSSVKLKYYEFVAEGIVPELFSRGMPDSPPLSSDYEETYPQLNQTCILFQHINSNIPSDSIKVLLNHTMPWFDKFLVRINGSGWKELKDNFLWVLGKGENTIEAKAVNLAGIEGKVSRIVLRNNIEGKP